MAHAVPSPVCDVTSFQCLEAGALPLIFCMIGRLGWQALDSERLREELFSDHMKERDRKVREARKAEQKKRAADFKELLDSVTYIKVGPSAAEHGANPTSPENCPPQCPHWITTQHRPPATSCAEPLEHHLAHVVRCWLGNRRPASVATSRSTARPPAVRDSRLSRGVGAGQQLVAQGAAQAGGRACPLRPATRWTAWEVFQAHLKCATALAPHAAAWHPARLSVCVLPSAALRLGTSGLCRVRVAHPLSLTCLSAAPAVHGCAAEAVCCARLLLRLTPGCGRHLEKAEREALEKEKAERMRKERQNRDAFRELLLAHAGEGKIHAKLRWKVRPCRWQAKCEGRGVHKRSRVQLCLPAGLPGLRAQAVLSPARSSAQLSLGWPGAGIL